MYCTFFARVTFLDYCGKGGGISVTFWILDIFVVVACIERGGEEYHVVANGS